MAPNITNLPVEVLSIIISSVAKLPDGARDVAISMSTCQRFLEASNSIVVHRAVCFHNVQVLGRSHLFQKTNGLLYKCGKAGNPSAEYLLAQVILATSTQMRHLEITKERLKHFRHYSQKYKHGRHNAREDTVVASFMARFTPAPRLDPTLASGSKPNPSPLPLSFHWDFVKAFILKSTPSDFQHMSRHLHDYVYVFVGCRLPRHIYFPFLYLVDMLLDICTPYENTILVREDGDYFIRYGRGFVPRRRGVVTEVIDWTQAGAVFEEVRARVLDAYDVLIPALR